MADAKKTIDLIFNGVDRTGAAVQSAIQNTKSFGSSLSGAAEPIADLTQSALKFEAAILATGAAVVGFAVKEAATFESAVADLNKVLGEGESFDDYADSIQNLSETYGVSSAELVGALANYKQAGFEVDEANTLLEAGLQAVIAGNVDAAASADLLVASIKGFGAEASESTRIVDLLNEVSNQYATNFNELLIGFAEFSPIAKTVGLSLEETVGILTPGIEVFRSGSEVATALRTSFVRLTGDTKNVQDALAELGVSQRDANGELRSGRDIYFDVADAFKALDENQKIYLAGQIAGANQSARFIAVTEGLDKTLRISGDAFKFLGSAAKEVEIQLATTDRVFDRVGVSLENLFITLGSPLLDEFSGVGNAIVAAFGAIGAAAKNAETGGLADFSEFLQSALAGLEADILQIAENLPAALEQADFSGFVRGLEAIGDGVSELFGGVDITTVDGLVDSIELLGGGFEALSEFTSGALKSFRPLFDGFRELIDQAGGVAGAFEELGKVGGAAIQIGALADAFVRLEPVIGAVAAAVGLNAGAGLVGSLSNLAKLIGGGAGGAGLLALLGKAGLVGAAGAAGVAIGKAFNETTIGENLRTSIVDLAADLTGLDDKVNSTLTSFDSTEVDATTRAIREADEEFARIAGSIERTQNATGSFASEAGKVAGALESQKDAVGTIVPLFETYEEVVARAGANTNRLGSDGAQLTGYFSVVSSGANSAAKSITSLADASDELRSKAVVAAIEGATEINVARIEADAERVQSAFQSIDSTVQSTGDQLKDLFGLLGDDNISKFDKLGIQEQIRKEDDRRERLLKKQEALLQTEINKNREQAAAFRRGDALIRIDGAGLQPHLEAFMFEILESIQVRVNEDGQKLLLGLG